MSTDLRASLAIATAAFKSTLEAAIGPVDLLHAETDEGVPYIGFKNGGSLLLSVAPYAAGWAVLIEDDALRLRSFPTERHRLRPYSVRSLVTPRYEASQLTRAL